MQHDTRQRSIVADAKQIALFPEPVLEYASKDTMRKQRATLDAIALRAANYPLLTEKRGRIGFFQANWHKESRLLFIKKHLDGEVTSIEDYLVKKNDEIIGYAAIWDGWLAIEAEYSRACVELAFLNPLYKPYTQFVKNLITVQEKNIEHDW